MLVQAQLKNFPPIVGFAQADVLDIPLPGNSVDLAICNSAFPHFDHKASSLKEIARVLRTNGRLVICHTMSRAMVNQLHQSIGGAVANHLLPDEFQLRGLIKQADSKIIHFEDGPERYLVIAEKNLEPQAQGLCPKPWPSG
jgi:ubiquinone/menaquinone biosynthesis C-methylase UbiE